MEHVRREFYVEGIGICIIALLGIGFCVFLGLGGYEENKMHPIMIGLFACLFMCMFIVYMRKVLKGWDYKIKEFLRNHTAISWENLMEDSQRSIRINSHLSIGEEYIFFIENDLFPKVLCKADIKCTEINYKSTKQGSCFLTVEDQAGERYEIWVRTKKKVKKAISYLSM